MSFKEKSIWDLALEEVARITEENGEESSLLVLGSKNGGKTSIVLRFLDRDEPAKPTTALEYTYARRNKGHNLVKDVAHIWELGGGAWLAKLIDVPLTKETINNLAIALVLDLSKPQELWSTFETLMKYLKSRIDGVIQDLRLSDPDIRSRFQKKAWERIGADHLDHDLMDPFPLPLVIFGTKYDIFQDFESEKRKTICRVLRFVAHYYGASLQFLTMRQENLVNKSKSILGNLLFQTAIGKSVQLESSKPLVVPAGTDSFQQIGPPPLPDGDLGRISAGTPIDLWKKAYIHHFPQEMLSDPALIEDPGKDVQYKEIAVDDMRIHKDQELERYRKQSEKKARETKA